MLTLIQMHEYCKGMLEKGESYLKIVFPLSQEEQSLDMIIISLISLSSILIY